MNSCSGLPDTITLHAHPSAAAMILKHSHGRGRPKATSKMFDPMDDETAMSPCPCCATITEESRSGTDVPAARIVRPMTTSGMPTVLPKISASSTMMMANRAIITIDPNMVRAAYFSIPGGRQSTTRHKSAVKGIVMRKLNLFKYDTSGSDRSMRPPQSPSNILSVVSTAASAVAFSFSQKRESKYHVVKSSYVRKPSAVPGEFGMAEIASSMAAFTSVEL